MPVHLLDDNANEAALLDAVAEIEYWNDLVVRGKIKREHAQGYVDAQKNIIRIKRAVLAR
jgi:hypothetical protein